jgi:NAD(P)-dependent dehydrogenase (short-subunit alcohol dehydrogenase family)
VSRPLEGRSALVTGASRGIGRQIALRLAADGAAVAVNYRRDADAAAEVVERINAAGGRAAAFPAAIGDARATSNMVGRLAGEFGDIDILVSNGGTASSGRTVAETTDDEYVRLMSVHALGPMGLVRDLLPSLRRSARSDVVVVSSVLAARYPMNSAPYTMAKLALEAGIRTLAREERARGVRANIVAPGLVATDMGSRLVAATTGGTVDDLAATYPFGRVAVPEDVAGVVAFLVSAEGEYLTGQRIEVDGGGATGGLFR